MSHTMFRPKGSKAIIFYFVSVFVPSTRSLYGALLCMLLCASSEVQHLFEIMIKQSKREKKEFLCVIKYDHILNTLGKQRSIDI